MGKVAEKETPLMKQYNSVKSKYPDAIVLFRVGDFYETFGKDAVLASGVLGIVLTKRANGAASEVELAGFPYHSLESYLPKLVRAGYRVAICEQLEDPKMAKGIVKRGITEVVSPGVALSDNLLEPSRNNFLAALYIEPNGKEGGAAFVDVSTGDFYVAEDHPSRIKKWIEQFQPNEILVSKKEPDFYKKWLGNEKGIRAFDDWAFTTSQGRDCIREVFKTQTLKGFGLKEEGSGISACGAVLSYLKETRVEHFEHLRPIRILRSDDVMWLDKYTLRNLEVFKPMAEGGKSLFDTLNECRTSMGSRLLYRYLLFPVCNTSEIKRRQDGAEYFIQFSDAAENISEELQSCGDMERIVARISTRKANPRELNLLCNTLEKLNTILGLLPEPLPEIIKNKLKENISSELNEIAGFLRSSIQPDAPAQIQKGNVIRPGYNKELDYWREIAYGGKDYLLKMQQKEIERTGIPSLKIGFNSVFGYYLEVTHAHKDKVPNDWIRKQTLTQAERYITPELKEYEEKILRAEEEITKWEERLYQEILENLSRKTEVLQTAADLLALLDVFITMADLAIRRNYCRPHIDDSHVLELKNARHPVIESMMQSGEEYVPNDIILNKESEQIWMITGPNMSGKSALLRQAALCVLMGQAGLYVPCSEAHFGYMNRLFTRVGASDNLSAGESTFMVEMQETALILNNLTERSLLLMDEIGRGTATYDGISIARSIAEYLHEHPFRPLTLFATHYHELNELEEQFERIKNYSVSVKENDNQVLFLRKLRRGGSEHSFGIHVARMAGIPPEVVRRASEILNELESMHTHDEKVSAVSASSDSSRFQLTLFDAWTEEEKTVLEKIKALSVNELTPLQALQILYEWQKVLLKK